MSQLKRKKWSDIRGSVDLGGGGRQERGVAIVSTTMVQAQRVYAFASLLPSSLATFNPG